MTDAASTLASPTAAVVAPIAVATALSAWGSYALVLIALGLMLWRAWAEIGRLKEEAANLRAEIREQDRLRLAETKEMIRVTEASTALQQTRAQHDQDFLPVLQRMAESLVANGNRLDDLMTYLPPDRAPRIDPPRRPRSRGSR